MSRRRKEVERRTKKSYPCFVSLLLLVGGFGRELSLDTAAACVLRDEKFRNKYSPVSVKNPRFHLKMVHLSQFLGLGVAMLWPSLKLSLQPRRRLLEGPAGRWDGAALSQTAWPWTQEALAYRTRASRWKRLAGVCLQQTAASKVQSRNASHWSD